MKAVAPFGSWKSPITSDIVVAGASHFGFLSVDGGDLYWTESRPSEAGRTAIVRRGADGQVRDALPPGFNARSRVHEYGGGAYTVVDGVLWAVSFADQRIHRVVEGAEPRPITPELPLRFADLHLDRARGVLYCVREDHRDGQPPRNTIVAVKADGDAEGGRIIASGHDFFSSPRVSPDGRMIAWVSWDHPNMPWDGTRLWAAPLDAAGAPGSPVLVAGGDEESVMEPQWSPRGDLCFLSDRTGFWNLHRARAGSPVHVENLHPMDAEVGGPAWVFGLSHYAIVGNDRIAIASTSRGLWRVSILEAGRVTDVEESFTDASFLRPANGAALFIAGSADGPERIVRIDLAGGMPRLSVVKSGRSLGIDQGYLSRPEEIEFPTAGGGTAHGLFYAPCNKDAQAPSGELPPLLVMSHGGPTSQASGSLDPSLQFWTSRGIAVLDVNYRGSTGYGRAYRNSLRGAWGIADVDDCMFGAQFLAEQGRVDAGRTMIRGGSAGGYTTLAALTFRSYFRAGASYYGIGDLEALARDTHKFEARYLDRLVGPYPAARDTYRERSPAFHTERLSAPLIIFQGLEDRVVPSSQAVTMFDALRTKGVPVAYLPFEGEQHGFRRAANIRRALEAELFFYGRVFGFAPADEIEPVTIENL